MKSNTKLSLAISTILGMARSSFADQLATHAENPEALQEIIVTATQRSESAQNVPIAIQALSSETLDELNVHTADDFLRYLPNVTTASKGPGQNQIYMRGLSTVTTTNNVAGGVGSFPNVAVYLNDQSAQLPGRNLDIYAADLERIEVLEGPQGTLFGAGAQAGVVRYITNKPKLSEINAGAKGGLESTAHGTSSDNVEAYINLPLIADHFAARAVVYNDTRGGYIDNRAGTYTLPANAPGLVAYNEQPITAACPKCTGLPTRETINNSPFAASDYNPVNYRGTRLSALFKFNDDWQALVVQSNQTLRANGVFEYEPQLGDLAVQRYNPDLLNDKFSNTSWTVQGRLGQLIAIYTGGYLDRNITQLSDYTKYAQSGFSIVTYMCNAGPASAANPAYGNVNQNFGLYGATHCYSPSNMTNEAEQNTHMSHEFRLSTPDEWRFRAIGGLFYENYKIKDSTNFLYFGSTQAGFYPQAPAAGSTMVDSNVRLPGTVFFDDITRGYKQKSAFGELAYDLIPKTLTLTGGLRLYSMDTYELGSANTDYYCRTVVTCTSGGKNLDAQHLQHTFSGHNGKVNLSYKPMDGLMIYATWSQGFRPGGFNRGSGTVTQAFRGVFTIPLFFEPDHLVNKELGWKLNLLQRRLQINGALYQEDWSHVQLTVFNPQISNFTFSANGPDFRVRGLEMDTVFRATRHLDLMASAAWNHSEQRNQLIILNNLHLPISEFPTAGVGSPLAQSPPFQGNLRARYTVDVNDFNVYGQVSANHTAHSYSNIVLSLREDQPAYTTYDAAIGLRKDAWTAELYGENLSDTRAQLYIDVAQHFPQITTNRPRTFGMRVSYRFNGQ